MINSFYNERLFFSSDNFFVRYKISQTIIYVFTLVFIYLSFSVVCGHTGEKAKRKNMPKNGIIIIFESVQLCSYQNYNNTIISYFAYKQGQQWSTKHVFFSVFLNHGELITSFRYVKIYFCC